MTMFPLRRILAASLVLFATVPALLVAWIMGRAGSDAVEEMAGRTLAQLGTLVQAGTEAHLRQAHEVLDGIIAQRPRTAEVERTRNWLRSMQRYEPIAFALTRQSSDTPVLHFANRSGEYLGIETTAEGTRVAVRRAGASGREFYLAREPGDRSRPQAPEPGNFEPRTTSWYGGALQAKDRVFSPVLVSRARNQLMVTLSQPVYDADSGAAGVIATELYLRQLADVLRTQRITSRGGAFIVDEQGSLVASSAGDDLFTERGGRYERATPSASVNPAIRAGFAGLQALRARRSADTVAADTRLQRLPLAGDALLMVQRPFGEQYGVRWTLVVAAPESDFTAEINRAWKVAAATGAALIAFGTLIAFLLARGIGRRLRRLSAAAEQLGRGEIPHIDEKTRIAEVRRLSQVLHDSALQLRGYRDQVEADALALQQANETLESRVRERTSELAASREEALAAARAKAAFLATMSHEIRTPLNGVVGMSTLLAETPLDAEQRDYLETVRLSSDQLLAVINDILDFSKVESGKMELESEPLSVRGAVEEACDIAAPRAREKGLELIIDIPESGPSPVPAAIRGDITRLRQVLINLVNNAVKFTAQGEVAVHVRARACTVHQGHTLLEFRVTDTGVGVPPDRQASLFEAFTQVDASTTRKYGGTGLGLAICKRLVELMGGEIGVESSPGAGSTFWFTLQAPLAELAAPLSPADAVRLKSTRVLVVDDHATNVRVLTRQLQLWEMEVTSAESAARALEMLREEPLPEIIVTDMHMPEMDGVAFARAVKAHAQWARVPIVLLSSGFMPAGNENASLFAARLLKPARQNQLFDTLLRCVATDAAQGPARAPAVDVRKDATVLVADDNAVNLKVACAMLLKLGYEVRTATNGREAVEVLAQAQARGEKIAAVLMDVNMPEVDGLEATRLIHAAWGAASPPVIAVTAAASADDRARCQAAGMDDYLTKPLQVSALAQALEKWLAAAVDGAADTAAAASSTATPEQATATPEQANATREHATATPEQGAKADQPAAMLVDFSRLDEFREYDDEELTMTREVIGLFLGDTPPRLEALDAAVATQDAEALAQGAHALKGAAGNVGAVALQEAAGALEIDARAGWPPDARERVAELARLWDGTRRALEAWSPAPA